MLNSTRAVFVCACLGWMAASATADTKQAITIPAGTLSAALETLAQQTGVQLLYDQKQIEGLRTSGVSGARSAEAAVTALLKGTTLTTKTDTSGAILIAPAPSPGATTGASASEASAIHLVRAGADPANPVQSEQAAAQRAAEKDVPAESRKKSADETPQNTMIVTGTNIRGGGAPVGQQVEVITRDDIRDAGVASMTDLRNIITQNFSGGASNPATFNLAQNTASTISGTNNFTNTFNLRGLGSGSTLTLLNGRRIAPAGSSEGFAIRNIPINVIDRIEIVPDGGSAIYGSDAVGGVVNVVTRKDYQGVEASYYYGAATTGSYTQTDANLTAGQSWGSGSAFLYFNYADEGKLTSGGRDFISTELISPNTTLIPPGDRKGVFGSLTQSLTSRIQVGMDALWSEDNSTYELDPQLLDGEFPGSISLRSRMSHLSAHGDFTINDRWDMLANVDRSADESFSQSDNELLSVPEATTTNTITTLELTLRGSAFELPAGAVDMAFGALQRRQKYETENTYAARRTLTRDVTGAYAELVIPLARTLKANLAGRWDDYSGSGSRVTPKYGLSWQATEAFGLRASYSKAYRAPPLPRTVDAELLNFLGVRWSWHPSDILPDTRLPSPNTFYAATLIRSGNSGLVPESADIVTAGFDFKPSALPRLRASATYFNIDYSNIIFSIFPSRINNPDFAQFVTIRPDVATLQNLIDNAEAMNNLAGFPLDLPSVQLLFDGGIHNMAVLKTSGFDFNARYGWSVGPGSLSLSVRGTYVFNYELGVTSSAALVNNVDRVGDPLRLTVRTSLSYSMNGWSVSTGINYKGAYVDDIFSFDPPAPQPVGSTTTIDAGIRFDGSQMSAPPAWAKGLSINLNARNLFDRDPPYVQDFLGFNFDGANGDPIGRFVSLQVSKAWGSH